MFCKKEEYKVLGLMSGTSLDGLDLAYCHFHKVSPGQWDYRILLAETLPWEEVWKKKIQAAFHCSGPELIEFHFSLGHEFGKRASHFLKKHKLAPDFIASHGQTIYHQPHSGYTFQAGSGAAIAAQTGLPVICDFRSGDVALGGQGAPLVPAGDRLLFGDYGACINLGGFANLSFENEKGQRIAYDICPANLGLNYFSAMAGIPYDKDGMLASQGKVDPFLLDELLALAYFHMPPPKSLGREWLEMEFIPILQKKSLSPHDGLRTLNQFLAILIKQEISKIPHLGKGILLTGGGTHNAFLIHLLREEMGLPIVVPDAQLIDFKEALIFAFLGVLYIEETPNCLNEVTGARYKNIGGCLYQGKNF